MARYQDAWLRTQFEPDPDRFTVETPPDPAHGDMSNVGSPTVMMEAPVLQGGGEIESDALWENIEHIPPPIQIDQTPVDGGGTKFSTGSEKGRGYGALTEPIDAGIDPSQADYGRGWLGAVRGRDEGASLRETRQFGRPYRFFNEQWFGITTEGFEPPPITQGAGDRVLRRGLNAYPENDGESGRPNAWTVNVPSWKRGIYYQTNINRDFTPPNRTHHTGVRMVQPDIVTIIGDAPPPDKSDKYATPFSSLQKFLPKRRKLRGIRRVPGPWDEPSVAASEPQIDISSADGLVVS